MKNKFSILAAFLFFVSSFLAQAQEDQTKEGQENSQENFSKHKTEIIASLNKEKSIIEAEISCINAANKREDAKKCHDQKHSAMNSLREEREANQQKRIAQRRENLQNKLNKLDQKANEQKSKKVGK
ncbi:MAG: hypothetical protein SFV53_03325 [Rickettsiales bacterium]|nr:hypothetical protein [Rickettsiales bacterium]